MPRFLITITLLSMLAACGTGPAGEGDRRLAATTSVEVAGVRVEAEPDAAPQIAVPETRPSTDLVVEDLSVGEGAQAEPGTSVVTHYVGLAWSTGQEFDSSWNRGAPAAFSLGNVIEGWREGIPGMRVGGRRLLVIPPDLAYGEHPPAGSGIEPGETLVFVVDLLEVEGPTPTAATTS